MSESNREWPEFKRAEALYDEFAATKHGEKLASKSRYGLYRKKRFSHENYWRLLGPDANNLRHMAYTAQLAAHLERKKKVPSTPLARERKFKAAFGHDNAEALTGDINYIDKNKNHFTAEKKEYRKHLPEFYENSDVRAEMAEIAKHIIFDDTSTEGREFNMVEQAGYLQTCLKAWALVNYGKAKDFSDDDKHALAGITASVLGSTLDKTLDLYEGDVYPEFTQFINNRQRLMTEAFNTMPAEAFDIFGDKGEERVDAFNKARVRWAAHFNEIVVTKEAA